MVQLNHEHRERAVIPDSTVGLLADQRLDELLIPDPCHRIHDAKEWAGGAVRLAVTAGVAELGGVRHFGAAVPAGGQSHPRNCIRGAQNSICYPSMAYSSHLPPAHPPPFPIHPRSDHYGSRSSTI